jgi:hypothetical protein
MLALGLHPPALATASSSPGRTTARARGGSSPGRRRRSGSSPRRTTALSSLHHGGRWRGRSADHCVRFDCVFRFVLGSYL